MSGARQFPQVDFVDQVLSVLSRLGHARPNSSKLRSSPENLLVSNFDEHHQDAGFARVRRVFSLDDFGTGYFLAGLPPVSACRWSS